MSLMNGTYGGNSAAWLFEQEYERMERLKELEELEELENEKPITNDIDSDLKTKQKRNILLRNLLG